MRTQDRREFLKRLAAGAAYAAPAVLSFAAPAAGQTPGMSSQMNPMGGGHGGNLQAETTDSPWEQNPPPGRRPPGSALPDSL